MCVDLLGSVFFVYKGITILYSVLCRLCCESVVTCKKFHMLRSALVCAVESHSYLLVLSIFFFFFFFLFCLFVFCWYLSFTEIPHPVLYTLCCMCSGKAAVWGGWSREQAFFFFFFSTFICRDTPSCTLLSPACVQMKLLSCTLYSVLHVSDEAASCTLFCPACVQVKLLSWTVSCMRSGEAAVLDCVLHAFRWSCCPVRCLAWLCSGEAAFLYLVLHDCVQVKLLSCTLFCTCSGEATVWEAWGKEQAAVLYSVLHVFRWSRCPGLCILSCMCSGEAAVWEGWGKEQATVLYSVLCPACVQVKPQFEKAEAKNKLLSCTLYSALHVFRWSRCLRRLRQRTSCYPVLCPACVQVKPLFEKAEAKNKLLSCTLYSALHVFRWSRCLRRLRQRTSCYPVLCTLPCMCSGEATVWEGWGKEQAAALCGGWRSGVPQSAAGTLGQVWTHDGESPAHGQGTGQWPFSLPPTPPPLPPPN